jgi:peptidoglycan-associated lipoprotein
MSTRVTLRFSMSRPRPSLFTAALSLAVAVGGAGCASPGMSRKAKAPAAPAGQGAATAVGQATTTSAGLDPTAAETFALKTQGLAVSDAIAQACGITPRDPAQKPSAARFEFDSAALSEDDRAMLGQVARCLADGPLRDRKVVLTGRADPRGEPEYNMTLGGSRSDAVLRYMVDLGVGRPRMTATSRGEIDAVGKDEASWAHDRRVDVELAP